MTVSCKGAESYTKWVPELWKQRLVLGGLVLPLAEAMGFVELLNGSTVVRRNVAMVERIFGVCREGIHLVSLSGIRDNFGGGVRGELEFDEDNRIKFVVPDTLKMSTPDEVIGELCGYLEAMVFPDMASMPVFRQDIVAEWGSVLRPFAEVVNRIEKRQPLVLFTGKEPNLEYLRYLGVERFDLGQRLYRQLVRVSYSGSGMKVDRF